MNKKEKARQREIEHNKKLVEMYPFLYPRNIWTDEKVQDYNYTYTELNGMPIGWQKAFGEMFAGDLAKVLRKANFVDKYRVVQVKEKFGALRWYDNGVPEEIYCEYSDLLYKYERISEHTCIACGAFPVKMRNCGGWIEPYCDDCIKKKKPQNVSDLEEFSPVIKIRTYENGMESEREVDCSDIAERLQKSKIK